jgi:hypothetical protein
LPTRPKRAPVGRPLEDHGENFFGMVRLGCMTNLPQKETLWL